MTEEKAAWEGHAVPENAAIRASRDRSTTLCVRISSAPIVDVCALCMASALDGALGCAGQERGKN